LTYANDEYDYYFDCDGCTEVQMKSKASSYYPNSGIFDVIVYSISTRTIRAYKVDVEYYESPYTSYSDVFATEETLNPALKDEFILLASSITHLMKSRKVTFTGRETECPSSACLATAYGMAEV
jgi:hypothetical protein